jgi:hypothetical protein
VDKEALEKIIATARHHNPRFGITGLLVFGSGVFFQWLEGPKDNVTSLCFSLKRMSFAKGCFPTGTWSWWRLKISAPF